MNELTKDAAADLAAFLHRLRPEWQIAGIMTGLQRATMQHPNADAALVAVAAIRAAADRDNRTPAAIANDGPWWRGALPPPPRRHDRASICSVCSLPEDRCRELWADDHEFLSVVQARRAAATAQQRDAAPTPPWQGNPYDHPESTEAKIARAERSRPLRSALPTHDHRGRPIEDVHLP